MFSWGTFQRIFETKKFSKKKKKKGCFAPLCVPLGLKKPGDFTMSEGHGHHFMLIHISFLLYSKFTYNSKVIIKY
jgi:hypothetical protein